MAVDKNKNPDSFPEDETYDLGQNSENFVIAPWEDKRDKKEYIPAKGKSTLLHTEGGHEEEEISAFHSGIGDKDDLLVKLPETEELEIPFQYAARHKGRKEHRTTIYPEIPFEYGIHYEGEKFTLDNEQPYDHRVDAYPARTIKYSVTEKDPQPTKRPWEAQLDVHARVKQEIFEYAVRWRGKAAKESVTGAADLFTSSRGRFIGPGPTSVWNKSGKSVREIDNRSHGSGIIAREFYNWTDYEAEYEFKTLKATGLRNDPLAKVVSNGKLYSVPGADDDILGFIFRADKNNKDFYVFLWEGDSGIVTGTRNRTLNGYNVLTGGLTGRYSHAAAEKVFEKLGIITNMSDLGINPATYRSGMKLTSAQLNNYNNHMNRIGWGKQHYRVYRVTNGVMREVKLSYSGNGRGWRQDWFNLNWKNSVKIRCTGREVKIYIQSYKTGKYNPNNYQLAVRFNVNKGFESGSVGLLTFSQAVQFDKIAITRWDDIEGRIPATGWNSYKDPGSKQISSKGSSYVNSDAKSKAASKTGIRNPDYEVTSVSGIARDSKKGAISASVNGAITVKTYNPPDAGQMRVHSIKKKGTATITPEEISPNTAQVIFSDIDTVFGKDMRAYLKKNPDLILKDTKLRINVPSNPLDDWDLKGERFSMWRRNPKVIKTTKNFTDTIYAYQGWVESIDCRKEFDGLKWATYELDIVQETFNDTYDSMELKNEKVYMRTTEWYCGTYPADIKNDGVVSNKKNVLVDIPPMPEHYVEPNTGEVMYHGHEDVDFLLTQLRPAYTNEVWMGFRSSFDEINTKNTKTPINIINGRPIIKTNKINDQVEIQCADKPQFISWTSGKYIGYGKVNGRRPFFKNGLGKADMVDVPTDVVFIPVDPDMERIRGPQDYDKAKDGYVYNVSLPIVDVSDSRVKFERTNNNKTLRFYSDYRDAYIWYTDWYSDWHKSDETYIVKKGETLTIPNPITVDLTNDPTYSMSNTIIDELEVVSNNPFIDTWSERMQGDGVGWQGHYYQLPMYTNTILEGIQADGDYHEMLQEYHIPSYKTEVEIDIHGEEPIRILSVKLEDQTLPNSNQDGWTYSNNKLTLHGSAIEEGTLMVHYGVGEIDMRYPIQKKHGEGLTVYYRGQQLPSTNYEIASNELILKNINLNKYDWIHIQSYDEENSFDENQSNFLGNLVGTRIDPEVWFDWGSGSPLHDFLNQPKVMSLQAEGISPLMDDEIEMVRFDYDLDMEVVYPIHEAVDISNFTGEWEQFDTMPVEEGGLNGPGEWHGPPEEGYTEVTNLRNQNGRSGWYNPEHKDFQDYTFQFTVQVRGGDDDMYGAIFKFDPETLDHYSFEWDAYHSMDPPYGGTGVRGMAVYKNICLNPEDKEKARLQYTRIQLAHLPISWTAHANEINHIRVSSIGNEIKVWTNNVLRFDIIDSDEPLIKGAWGPATQSQPNTYFWDFSMEYFERITPKEEPSFRIPMSYDIERPFRDDESMIEVLVDHQVGPHMLTALNNFLLKNELNWEQLAVVEYFIRNDNSQYKTYFTYEEQKLGVQTTVENSEVYALVEGKEPPQLPPEEKYIEDQPEPAIPPLIPPSADSNDNFAASWNAYIYAPETGWYHFRTDVDDAVKVWVDNQLIIDEWKESGGARYEGSIYLRGGDWYPIKVNYAEVEGNAHIHLEWRRAGWRSFNRIDPENVSPHLGYAIKAEIKEETPMPWNPLIHNGYYYFKHKEHYLYAKEVRKTIVLDGNGDLEGGRNHLLLTPRPRQGSPIIIDNGNGIYYRKVNFLDQDGKLTLRNEEALYGNGNKRYYLKYENINRNTLRVFVNGQERVDFTWSQSNSFIEFNQELHEEDLIEASYILHNSFYVDMNHDMQADTAAIYFSNTDNLRSASIVYEGHFTSPFYRATQLLTNPLLNHNHQGFIYLTDQLDKKVKSVKINVSPDRIGTKGYEEVTLTAQIRDRHGNPVPEREVTLYKDDVELITGTTNAAGEFYYKDLPTVPEEMFSTYEVECDGIKHSALLNFFHNNLTQRAYIELKAGKSSIIGGVDDKVTIYATLRDHAWYVLRSERIHFEWIDTKGDRHSKSLSTNSNGQVEFTISGKQEVHGVIYVTASYDMGEEHAKSSIYIKSIGG